MSAFSSRFARTRWTCTGSTYERALARDLDALARAEIVDRLAHEVVEPPHLRLRLGAPRLEPREVEQVADEAAQAVGVDGDRVEQLGPVGITQLELVVAQRTDRGRDARQRRAQVVGDRAQERSLDEVAAAQRLGLERVPLEPAPVERDGKQRSERRQEAALGGGLGRPTGV